MKRIMVDMSAALIHHGHIRLLKAAKEMGTVVAALTTDAEIKKKKGYTAELKFAEREELFSAIRYVDEVVAAPWEITEEFLDLHKIDLLVHGHDNANPISQERLVVLPRTKGISTHLLRSRVLTTLSQIVASQSMID